MDIASIGIILSRCKQQRRWSDCADAQFMSSDICYKNNNLGAVKKPKHKRLFFSSIFLFIWKKSPSLKIVGTNLFLYSFNRGWHVCFRHNNINSSSFSVENLKMLTKNVQILNKWTLKIVGHTENNLNQSDFSLSQTANTLGTIHYVDFYLICTPLNSIPELMLSSSFAITIPLPPRAVTRNPALITVMIARPFAFINIPAETYQVVIRKTDKVSIWW